MKFEPDNLYHIFNQGNNKEQLFFNDRHYYSFLQIFQSHVLPHCDVLCWCLMPNHFHFMIAADTRCLNLEKQGGLMLDPITNGFRKLLSTYAHQFNKTNERTGSLFRPKTKSKCLSADDYASLNFSSLQSYLLNCFHYIHQNPVKAGLVDKTEDWIWSSCRFYKGLHKESFCSRETTEKYLDIIF
ncbi:MAG: transposase [Sphingobacteriales bacterium]